MVWPWRASRAHGMGGNVIVTEVEPTRALEAVMDGYRVMPMIEAAPIGDIFVTATGDKYVITRQHFENMKDGVIIANSGHFNVEIDLQSLADMASSHREARNFVKEYTIQGGKKIFLLADGRLVNLSAAEGHPAAVMDMSFANQALSVEHLVAKHDHLPVGVHSVPEEIDKHVALCKLESMNINIDKLTPEQEHYLNNWLEGT